MRDITLGITFYHAFTTRAFATGVPTVLAGTPVLSCKEENNATPITAGVSVAVDAASVVGLNEATIIATGGNGYEAGKSYSIYISTGTVGGVSVVGEVVGQFTVGQSAAAVDLANGTDGLGALKAETALIVADTGELQTDDVPTLIAALPTAVEIQAEIEANGASVIDTIRDQIGTAGAGLTDLGGMSTGMKSEVESEANDALVAQKLDHLVAVADGDDPVNNSIIAKLADLGATADWSAYVNTTDSLRALRDRGDAAWITATGFNTTVPDAAGTAPTAVEIQAEMEENGASVLDTIRDDLDNVTDGLGALKALLDTLVTGVVVKTMNTDVNDAVSVDADVWAEVLDLANGVDTGLTLRQFFRLVAAATFGKASGLATTSAKYR
ncbi:hypothetical protein LCGC14_2537030, partial [marine sediment metagenome]